MTADNGQPRTKRQAKAALGPYGRTGQIINDLDDRFGLAKGGRTFLDKIFPDHWSFMLGEIALYSFVVLIGTGIFLSFYFVPSTGTVIYHGSYQPLVGQRNGIVDAEFFDKWDDRLRAVALDHVA